MTTRKQTTMAIREDVAARVRQAAKEAGVKVLDLASNLLEAAMTEGKFELKAPTIVVRFPSAD